ncbi:hypothetical protein AB835_14120 [Candidatus Endobugula sertula]|uniref:Major facilitator superfamily (MFS) profile domain-containing protein n=1 Tax=Candidatus Endobugula sertula TaxID=62101 RepID=A0A1D2QLJ9_9GAMM|nr:hypothetical protein AB835_14120 [Candidatus Endobugula sertula]
MIMTLLSLFPLFLSGFILMLGYGLVNILVPSRLNIEGISADNIGLIMSMLFVGVLLGGVYSRRLIIRVGHIRVYAGCAALAAISILMCSLWVSEWLWGIMRILMGFCTATTNVVSDGWLSERATSKTRARILATNQVVLLAAMSLGSFMINIADPTDFTLYILAGILLCGAVVPIVMSKVSAPGIEDAESMSVSRLFRLSPAGVMAVLVCGILLSTILGMLPVYAKAVGISGFDVSLLVGAAIMGSFALQFPIGYLSDKFDRRFVMLTVVIISMVICLVIPLVIAAGSFMGVLLLVGVSSGVIGSLYPLGIAEAFDRLRQNEMGSAIGGMIIFYAVGGIMGPYAAGVVMALLGSAYFFIFMAVIHGALAAFVFYRICVRQSIPVDQQESFVAQTTAGLVISSELDPRIDNAFVENELSPEAQTAVTMARKNPVASIHFIRLLSQSLPEKVIEVSSAVASVEGVDTIRLYHALIETFPENFQGGRKEYSKELAEALIAAAPEKSAALVHGVFDDVPQDEVAELAIAITEIVPEQSIEILEVATGAVVEEHPEVVVGIAEAYLSNMSDNLEGMRYADRLADSSKQTVTDMVTLIAEVAPEQVVDVAAAAAEALPESASDVVEVLTESEMFEGDIVCDIEDKPDIVDGDEMSIDSKEKRS